MPESALSTACPSLVPLERLGAALHRERTRSGETMAGLSRRSDGRWLPDALLEVEQGTRSLDDDAVLDVVALYGLPDYRWLTPSAVEFVLDRSLSASPTRSAGSADWGHGQTQYEVGLSFVAAAVAVGIDLTSGVNGVAAVAEAMEADAEDALRIAAELLDDEADAILERIAVLSRRVVVPCAGLLIVEAPAGSLVMIHHARHEGFVPSVPSAGRLADLLDAAR